MTIIDRTVHLGRYSIKAKSIDFVPINDTKPYVDFLRVDVLENRRLRQPKLLRTIKYGVPTYLTIVAFLDYITEGLAQ